MIVTFGEILLRLSPPGHLRLGQARELELHFGGSEANAAVSLANYGKAVRFVTGLPDNAIGAACLGELRRHGVDASAVAVRPGRMGLYFYEKGASQRPSQVLYDREGSVFAQMEETDWDWGKLLEGADWFHFSGITPALGAGAAAAVRAACREAGRRGIPVSCDLNYRRKLWSREEAGRVLAELLEDVDVLITGAEDAAELFGIRAAEPEKALSLESYRAIAEQLAGRFGLQKVAFSRRESASASRNRWSALLYDGRELYASRWYDLEIVDRIGGGDSFAGGLLYGLTEGYESRKALDFAAAAACLKHTIEGDFNAVSAAEVLALADGGDAGRVQR